MTLGVSAEEHAGRMRQVRDEAARRGLDGLLVWSKGGATVDSYADVFYLCNWYTPIPRHQNQAPLWAGRGYSALYLPADGDPVLVVDLPDFRRDLIQAVDDVRVGLNVPATVARALHDRGAARGRIGVSGVEILPWTSYRLLADEVPEVRLEPADDVVERLRMIKSEAELEALRRSAQVGCALVEAIIDTAQGPGKTEAEAVAAGHKLGIEHGAAIWDSAVASGPNSHYYAYQGLPSWSQRTLESGDLFHVDAYGAVDGYIYDLARSCVCGGKATPKQREVLEGAIKCVEAMIAEVRPGVAASRLYEVGHAYLLEHGLAGEEAAGEVSVALVESFPAHGHGIGTTNERPWLRAEEHLPLQERMVLAIETMAGRAEVGAAGFEHDVIVTADGFEVITASCPSESWE